MSAPYYYHGLPSFAEMIYPELKGTELDKAAYAAVRKKYEMAFVNSRPYNKTVTPTGAKRFDVEWYRTLRNLKAMYGYIPPTAKPRAARSKPEKVQTTRTLPVPKVGHHFATTANAAVAHKMLGTNPTPSKYRQAEYYFKGRYTCYYLCGVSFKTAWRRLLLKVREVYGVDHITGRLSTRPNRKRSTTKAD